MTMGPEPMIKTLRISGFKGIFSASHHRHKPVEQE
jgi:hypothetical protein